MTFGAAKRRDDEVKDFRSVPHCLRAMSPRLGIAATCVRVGKVVPFEQPLLPHDVLPIGCIAPCHVEQITFSVKRKDVAGAR